MATLQDTFEAHGFIQGGKTDDQVFGECPFCSGRNKFYLNPKTGQFDCKKCSRTGNTVSFLEQVVQYWRGATKRKHYKALSKLRGGIPAEAFASWGLAYDGDAWLFPCLSETGTMRDIRHWRPNVKGIRSTKGCKTQLFGMDRIAEAEIGIDGVRVFLEPALFHFH